MGQSIAPGVTYCLAGGRVIFMDLRTGRFSGLPPHHEEAFIASVTGQAAAALAPPTEAFLAARKLCVESDAADLRVPLIPLPQIDLIGHTAPTTRASLGLCLLGAIAQARAEMALRTLSFRSLTERLRRRKRIVAAAPGQRCEQVADKQFALLEAAIRRTDLLLPPSNRCLGRSIAFLSMALSRNLAPDLVIGVRSNPFRAHAWVQSRGRVIHDDQRQAPLFTPIFML